MKDKKTIILIIIAILLSYSFTNIKKRRGSIEVGPLDKGEFITDN